jgi:hypothetical protein
MCTCQCGFYIMISALHGSYCCAPVRLLHVTSPFWVRRWWALQKSTLLRLPDCGCAGYARIVMLVCVVFSCKHCESPCTGHWYVMPVISVTWPVCLYHATIVWAAAGRARDINTLHFTLLAASCCTPALPMLVHISTSVHILHTHCLHNCTKHFIILHAIQAFKLAQHSIFARCIYSKVIAVFCKI